MKNINQHTTFLQLKCAVLLLVILSGCTKDLDLNPRQEIHEKSFWKSANHFKIAANNYYAALLPRHAINELDNDSDLAHRGRQNLRSAGKNILRDNDIIWNRIYEGLRQINTMLVRAAEYKEDKSEIAISVAEGKFFRAFAYFQLVVRFGDVPYFDRPLTGLKDELLKKPRTRRDTVINNILKDLDEAAKVLPLQSALAAADIGRVTKGAAYALKARVALFEATWAKYHKTQGNVNQLLDQAIAAARAVIESGEYELYTYAAAPEESYLQSYLLAGNDSREQILARRHAPGRILSGQNHAVTGFLAHDLVQGTKKLADMYVCTDGLPVTQSKLFKGYKTMTSEYENRDWRMSNTFMIPGSTHNHAANEWGDPNYPNPTTLPGYRIRKLVSTDQACWTSYQCAEFKHILKYSEVLLNLAEALYEKNSSISDSDLEGTVNLLRARGGVAKLTNQLVTDNGLNMLDEIRRERSVELAFDNFRLNDLKRWKTAVSELNEDIKGVNIGSGAWPEELFPGISAMQSDAKGFKIVEDRAMRQFAERNYLFPLPARQIQLSQGVLTQNPGW